MVVIESATNSGEGENHVNAGASQTSDHLKGETTEREPEGFETASEGEVGSDGDEQPVPPKDGPQEGASNDEELKQQALSQANDAKAEGNLLFGSGQYEDALSKYELALQIAPEMPSSLEIRSICHANRAICFSKLGKYDDTVKECTKALELNPTYMKALIRRAEAHEKLDHLEEAIDDMKKILELDPSNDHARKTICRLEPVAAEKREKMKEEMIGKLKDMGNSILGRFGMSLDNFKAVKDPNTGSYSVSLER